MKTKIVTLVISLLYAALGINAQNSLPEGFVYANDYIPDLQVELRYYSTNNFIGDTITGYKSNKLILSKAAVLQLKKVQEELSDYNLCLRVYDGYRPQRAVDHFVKWAKNLNDTLRKADYYPHVKKNQLFEEGYIAAKSGHSKGSTIDVVLVDGATNQPLDMGTPYDFFGKASWVNYKELSPKQKANRQLLQDIMLKYNFKNYPREWWHFTLKQEPFPNTYFNFDIN